MHKKRYSWWFGLLATLLILLTGCANNSDDTGGEKDGLHIVTSFYPIYALTDEIAGEVDDVRQIGSKQGIHSYEPSAADLGAISDADVFIYHSDILEGWTRNLEENFESGNVSVIEASKTLELKRVEGLEDVEAAEGVDEHSLYDPHTWLDPLLVADEADYIAERLSDIDPDHKDIYQKNSARLRQEAEQLTKEYQERFDTVDDKTFVTQHTAFSYLADRFGLKQLGISGIEEEEPSPRRIAEITEFVQDNHVKTIFTEPETSQKKADVIAESTGATVKELNPLEADPENDQSYLENLADQLALIADDLESR